MAKKMLVIPMLILSMVFMVQCKKDFSYPGRDDLAAGAGKGKGGGGETESAVNNLSFPVIALDGFTIADLENPSWEIPYTGPYTGLTAEELEIVQNGTWYAQKVTGNKWQAAHSESTGSQEVTFIDWGDVIESSNPKLGRPFRIEVTLYVLLEQTMDAYTMALLAFPSSPNEVQGTNSEIYQGNWATVTSPVPKLIIQYLGETVSSSLTWDGSKWNDVSSTPNLIPFKFAAELNVGGKYIFGGSEGGWKPDQLGFYRLTFIPSGNIYLENAVRGNYNGNTDNAALGDGIAIPPTGGGTPKIDGTYNISYVDVKVVSSGGGGGGKRP